MQQTIADAGSAGDGLELVEYQPDERCGPPLLFVHGAFTAAWCWEVAYLPYFAEAGFPAFAVSLSGHGASGGHERLNALTLEDYADDVAEAVDAMDEPPIIIGHSMGGLVADIALRRGVEAAGLVLLAAVPPTGLTPSALQMMVSQPRLAWHLGMAQVTGPRALEPEEAQAALFAGAEPAEPAREASRRMQPESQVALFQMGLPRWPRLGGFRAPVAVIGAAEDVVIPPWMVRATGWLHGVTPRWIPETGHAVMLEPRWQPGAEVLEDALRAVAGPA